MNWSGIWDFGEKVKWLEESGSKTEVEDAHSPIEMYEYKNVRNYKETIHLYRISQGGIAWVDRVVGMLMEIIIILHHHHHHHHHLSLWIIRLFTTICGSYVEMRYFWKQSWKYLWRSLSQSLLMGHDLPITGALKKKKYTLDRCHVLHSLIRYTKKLKVS